MKRWLVGGIVLVVLGMAGGAYLLSQNLNEIVRTAIESQGSAALGTAVRRRQERPRDDHRPRA